MAGHNKCSNLRRLNAALDTNRGKLFTGLTGETTLAAGSPDRNPLRHRAASGIHRHFQPGGNEIMAARPAQISN